MSQFFGATAPLPIIPEAVLREHQVHEAGDTRFRACARLLQTIWRSNQRLAIGQHATRKGGKRRIGSLLAATDAKAGRNFMSPTLAKLARHELMYREPGALIAENRLFANLLSSQPLAFNLFGPLRLHPDLALPVIQQLLPETDIARILHVAFEHSPGRMDPSLTHDRSAFDVAIGYERRDGGRGLLAIELKYSETLSGAAGDDDGSCCDALAEASGLFKEPSNALLRTPTFNQLFREHLLAQASVMRGDWGEARFMLIAPRHNHLVHRGAGLYAAQLSKPLPGQVPFHVIELEQVIEAFMVAGEADYAAALHERYTNWSRVDALVAQAMEREQPSWAIIPPKRAPLSLVGSAA